MMVACEVGVDDDGGLGFFDLYSICIRLKQDLICIRLGFFDLYSIFFPSLVVSQVFFLCLIDLRTHKGLILWN